MKVDFFRHGLCGNDAQKIADVLNTPFLTSGKIGREVEAQLCDYFSVNGALLTNSWTNGAVATLLAMGIGPGDEVIVPAMTFIATANVVELVGATTVFVDVCPESLLLQPQDVVKALTPHTKAVIPVHLYGQMCDVEAIRHALDRAGRSDVRIIEDCAHCFEGRLKGHRPGRFSDAAIFSFYATKNVTCGEGGAIISNDNALMDGVARARLHGMSKAAIDRFETGQYQHWDMKQLGTKANLPDLLAVLLPDQIRMIDQKLVERHRLSQRYREALADGPVRLVTPVADCLSAEHLFAIHIPGQIRDQAIHVLNKAGIGATVNYRAVPDMSYYRQKYDLPPDLYPNSKFWGEGTISIPLFPGLSDEEQSYVIDVVRKDVYPLCDDRVLERVHG